jgi:putative addiction module component (TIGR02574 family)
MSVDISLNELTTAEKLELMERLWVDLSRQPQEVPSPAWHGVVLDGRCEAVRQGRTTFVAWEEARQRLLDRHG